MRFVVCARDRVSGETRVIGARSFVSKDEAIAALGGLDPAGLAGDDEFFLVDLEAATPVVLVPTHRAPAASAPMRPEQFAGATEPLGSGQEAVAELADTAFAAELLAEAAGTSESWPFVEPEIEGVGTAVAELDLIADDSDRSEVWWHEVGVEVDGLSDAAMVPADAVDVAGEPPAPFDAPFEEPGPAFEEARSEDVAGAPETAPQETSALTTESDEAQERLFVEPMAEEAATELPAMAEDVFGEMPVAGEDVLPEAPAYEDETPPETPADHEAAPAEEAIFVPVDYAAFACSDCIFVETCDSTTTSSPATCMSFQWRAE